MRFLSVLALFCLSLPALAGGFYIELGTPSASKDGLAKDAFVVARLTGCHQPERGTLTATAEGIVNGKRQTITAKVTPLSTPGMFAVAQTWPTEGTWMLHLAATHPEWNVATSTLVKVDAKSFVRASAKMANRSATKSEIESFLH